MEGHICLFFLLLPSQNDFKVCRIISVDFVNGVRQTVDVLN